MLRTPKFWYSKKKYAAFVARTLTPISLIWEFFSTRKISRGKNEKFNIPIICVGNINIGGSGKTPTTIALAKTFLEQNIDVHIVSKGYKGKLKGPKKVSANDQSCDVGDEPILMSSFAPVWIAKNRRSAVIEAIADGAELLIFDDGFQDTSIKKTVSIITVDSKLAFGNCRVLPSGPLRETIYQGLNRADILLITGTKVNQDSFPKAIPLPSSLKVFHGEINVVKTGIKLDQGKFIAVAGIANPEKFFDSIEAAGGKILKRVELSDHAPFSLGLINRLKKLSLELDAQIITTEKDSVRIPQAERQNFISLPVRLSFLEEEELIHFIKSKISQSSK